VQAEHEDAVRLVVAEAEGDRNGVGMLRRPRAVLVPAVDPLKLAVELELLPVERDGPITLVALEDAASLGGVEPHEAAIDRGRAGTQETRFERLNERAHGRNNVPHGSPAGRLGRAVGAD
jgi:hypothetical protein